MNNTIWIELYYRPAPGDNRFGNAIQIKDFRVPKGTDISKILPLVHAKGLAKCIGNKLNAEISGDYLTLGELEDNTTYKILSGNIPETIKAMNKLKRLNV